MKIKQILSSLLAATMIFGSVTANAVTVESDDMPKASGAAVEQESSGVSVTSNKTEHGLPANLQDGAILHAWCWSCNTITANMKDIADAGYTAIQTSPMQQSYARYSDKNTLMGQKDGADVTDGSEGAWWWQYQPTAQKLGNYQFFTEPNNETKCEQEYAAMCSAAEDYGISIITDVVSNHTTSHYVLSGGVENKSGQIDISSEMTSAVGGYNNLWHPNAFISKGSSSVSGVPYRTRLINYMNGGLPDVNTENEAYQAYVVKYLNKLIELGCDGFRFDTAHRIGISTIDGSSYNYWDAVTGVNAVNDIGGDSVRLGTLTNSTVSPNDLFIYGELLKSEYNSGYTQKIRVTDFNYGQKVRSAVKNGSVSSSSVMKESTYLHTINGSASNNITWVESHDDYCNSHDSKNLTESDIHLSWAILTARKAGTPLFFSRPNGSNALEGNYWGNNIAGAVGNDDFKDPEISAVNHFRNAMASNNADNEYLWNVNGDTQILQIDRYNSSNNTQGNCGTVIVNTSSSEQYIDTETKIAAGLYRESVTGSVFEVYSKNGKNYIKGHLFPKSVAVVYETTTASFTAVSDDNTFVTATNSAALGFSGIQGSAAYSFVIDGDIEHETSGVNFTNNQSITFGNDVDNSNRTKRIWLILRAKDTNGNDVCQYFTYLKLNENDLTHVYFDNSTYQWKSVYAYIYQGEGSSKVENHAWPGVLMKYDTETGYYKYNIPYNLKDGNIIFTEASNSTTNRYPADGDGGLALNPLTTMLFSENNSWGTESAKAAQIDAAYNNSSDSTYNLGAKNYLYFFDSFGMHDVKVSVSGASPQSMTWSDALHCYYYEYNSGSVSSLTFTTKEQVPTGSGTEIQSRTYEASLTGFVPGKLYVPTSTSSGEWKELSDIQTGRIYLNVTDSSWTDDVRVHIYRENGQYENAAYPGESMTKLGSVTGISGDLYSYIYYYIDGYKYDKVKFVDVYGTDTSKYYRTDNKTLNTDDFWTISTGKPSGSYKPGVTGSALSSNVSVNKSISVIYKYYDRSIGDPTKAEVRKLNTSYTANSSDLNVAVDSALGTLGLENIFDNYVYRNSQFECVKMIASHSDANNKRNNGVPYGGKINPKFLSNTTSSFGGRFGDDVGSLSVKGENWVTYYDGTDPENSNVINPDDVLPDLSNVASVVVWGFSEPKTYSVRLNYPTTASIPTKTVSDDLKVDSYTGTKQCVCGFDQLISGDNANLTPGIQVPTGYVFDGWYQIEFDNNGNVDSYVKMTENQRFTSRVTKNVTLYAVYAPTKSTVKAASVTANPVDISLDEKGNKVYHYNTLLNIFNCEKSDKKITDVGVVYVNLSGNEAVDYDSVKSSVSSIIGNGTASGSNYRYFQYSVKDGEAVLTNKNRIQFTFTLNESQISGAYSNVAAFAVYKYAGQNAWVVSENCVQYRYSGGSVTVTEMNR